MDLSQTKQSKNELPSAYADRLGLFYSSKVDLDHKKELGQFFTSISIATFMASFCHVNKRSIKILDPGAGLAILSCALIEYIVENYPFVTDIELTAFETDEQIIAYTDLSLNYLSKWVSGKGVSIKHYLCKNDFILHNSKVLNKETSEPTYDIIISNPPYFKIPNSDSRAVAAKEIIYGQSNIYSVFMIVAAKLLNIDGQLIFITPRSFASGSYFKSFREIFFSILNINYIHLFNSRKEAFERDSVLQENIIVVGRRKNGFENQLSLLPIESIVQISSSSGILDIEERNVRNYKFEDLVDMSSTQKILHIPSSEIDDKVIGIFKSWNGSFSEYGIKISTGPIVDFRSEEIISVQNAKDYVPLIYLHNIDKMSFTWPLKKVTKGKEKGQYIKGTYDVKALVPNMNYVLLRRFSSKDDNSKLIATPYIADWLSENERIGLENHLNYIYREVGQFSIDEIYGVAALLNSKIFDVYFRTFNGNVNVSATELRNLPLPDWNSIIEIGLAIKMIDKLNQEQLDNIVEDKLIATTLSWKN